MIGAITFSVALAGFLLGCLIAALITEPSEDLSSDGADGDWPFMAADDLKLFHATQNTRGGQHGRS